MGQDRDTRELLEQVRRLKWDFYRTIEPHRSALYGYCCRLTGDPFDAEDLHQETLLRAFAKLSERFETLSHPKAYLFRIATNLWIDWHRRDSRRADPRSEAPHPSHADPPRALTRELVDGASSLLDRLPPREASVLLLREVFDYSVKEAAELVGCTEASVKMAMSRARKRLAATEAVDPPAPLAQTREVLERFAHLFKQRDLRGLLELIDEHARARVLGCAEEASRDEITRGSLHQALTSASIRDVSVESWRGQPLLAVWYDAGGTLSVRDLLRIQVEGDSIVALDFYYFSPELLREVCDELGLPQRGNGRAIFEQGWWNDAETESPGAFNR